jgi:hypothetical protein
MMPSDEKRLTLITRIFIGVMAFCIIMLLWQFYNYDKGMTQAQIDHPAQQHFFFYNTNAGAPLAPVTHRDAHVRQVEFNGVENSPSAGSFTCAVTLKNDGSAKAVNVQVMVRPFRGIPLGDEDVGGPNRGTLSDNDPRAQFGQWVAFPDLAPGESSTQKVTFIMQSGLHAGNNPSPDIQYETAKDAATPAP